MEEIRKIAKKLYAHEPELYPEDLWDDTLELRIQRLDLLQSALSEKQFSYALCVKAGLFLWNESLQQSHTLAQDVPHSTGSYWHGIMHRMEGDYSNSKYWFRQTGQHPIFTSLGRSASKLLGTELSANPIANDRLSELLQRIADSREWKPDYLIDAIQLQAMSVHDERAGELLRRIQHMELAALLEYSYSESFGGNIFNAV